MFVTRWKFSTQDARLFDPSNYITATLTLKYFLSRSARFAPLESVAIAAEAKHLRCYQSPSAIYDIEGQKKELWRAFISLICSGSVSLIQIFIMVAKLPVEIDLKVLNASLETKSYINGYFPSSADVQTFSQIKNPPTTLPHLQRWFHHIASFTDAERAKWPKCGSEPVASAEGDDEDIDLFGSSSEEPENLKLNTKFKEDNEEKKRVRQERLDAYAAKKAKKPVAVAKSNIILDVKPWDDETDLKLMEESIRNITTDGLIWGPSKILPVAYGVKKLQIGCVVEDDKVGTDFLEENILALEDLVQSVDIVAFNKI
ncbi:Elongation factor 1-beta [Trichinella britovi]|uniref:Elongation factor 1-beta n=1 Tax=Trichinella britovi TaxID=45882 RepID=A0A0V1CI64_TRIBR|nr:Elongation factor 1-beta [Trichinella britovi]